MSAVTAAWPQDRAGPGGGAAPLVSRRIEMVVPTLASAGQEVMVADLAHALACRGHQVGVTCIQAGGPIEDRLAGWGIPVAVVPTPGVLANLRGAPGLAAHFRARAPDVVHVHSGAWGKAAAAARRAGDMAVLFTLHGVPYWEPRHWRWLHRLSARSTDAVVAVSAALRDYLVDEVGVPGRQVTVLINGIDTQRYAPMPGDGSVRARLGVPPGRALVGTVARLNEIKNQALLLDAFARLRQEGLDADLALFGDGELREALVAQAAALDITGRVHFVGAVDDTAPVYRELDVFVLCSLNEGTSMSVLEAMASGTPVVATAVGGTPALLEGGCGTLVPSGDAPALAAAIGAAVREPVPARAMAARARERAVTRYGREAMVDGYERVYERLLAARRRPSPA